MAYEEGAENKNEFKHNVEKDLKTDGEMIKLASLLAPLDMYMSALHASFQRW